MHDTDVISAARIEQTTFAGFPGASIVHVTVPSGEHRLFAFYADEYRFGPEDFVGLTVAQAQQLHFDRDVAYLRSP